jgi:hypothetical protein
MGAASSPFRWPAPPLKSRAETKLGPFFVQLVTQHPGGRDRHEEISAPEAEEKAAKRVSLRPLMALRPYLLRHTGMLAAGFAALLVSAGATLAVPLAVRRMIDLGFSGIDPDLIDKYFITLAGIGLILLLAAFPRDYHGTPIDSLPLMKEVRNYASFPLFINLSVGYPGTKEYVQYAQTRFNITMISGAGAVSVPEFSAYLQSGQLKGLLMGIAGGAEYEQLIDRKSVV